MRVWRGAPDPVNPPRPLVEPCLDCDVVPDPDLGCECDRAGTLEERLDRALRQPPGAPCQRK